MHLSKNKDLTDRAQRRAIKMVPELRELSYNGLMGDKKLSIMEKGNLIIVEEKHKSKLQNKKLVKKR